MHRHKVLISIGLFIAIAAGMLLSNGTALAADSLERPDTTGDVGRWSTMALDSNGYPIVAYHEEGSSVETGTLKILHCGNATCTSGNNIATIDEDEVWDFSKSMQLDGDGNPVIAYMSSSGDLMLANCDDADCESPVTVTVDSPSGNTIYLGVHLSLTLDPDDGYAPVISYLELRYPSPEYVLNVARCDDADCASPSLVELDPPGAVQFPDPPSDDRQFTGFGNDIVLDDDGYPVISFTDDNGGHIVHCGNTDCSSDNYSGATFGTGHDETGPNSSTQTRVLLDSNGYPIVAYQDIDRVLTVVHCNDADCDGGNESIETPDTEYVPSGEPDTGLLGLYVSMTLNSSGNPVISYHTHTFGDLKLLVCGNTDCDSGNTITTVERDDHAGAFTSLRLNSSGYPVISHNYQGTEDLGVVVCDSADCDGAWPDDDGDGCANADDAEDSDFWDFFDTPDSDGFRDRQVTQADVDAVAARYSASGNPDVDPLTAPPASGYHPAFDRTYVGGVVGPPDGQITLDDIFAVGSQKDSYDCR